MKRISIVLKSLVLALCGGSAALAAPPAQVISPQPVSTPATAMPMQPGMLPAPAFDSAAMSACPCDSSCPTACHASDWVVEADWLYWKAHRNGLDFAILDAAADPILGPADVVRIRPDHDSGFRIGLFRRSSSGLDAGVRYTHFDSRSDGSIVDPAGNSTATRIHPDIAADVGDQSLVAGVSEYDLEYRLLDLEAGYTLDINCNSSVRPFAGLRFAHIDQGLDSLYGDAVDFSGIEVVRVLESVDMDSWGLFAGAEAQWGLGGRGLHVFGRGAAGLHHARFDSQFIEFEVPPLEAGDDPFNARVTDGDRRIVPSLEAQVGLGYDVYEGCRGSLGVQVGYDLQTWFNMADFIKFNDDILEGNIDRHATSLGLDGWFIRVLVTR
jgi:hypothetical protein